MLDFKNELNSKQLEAVSHVNGPLLVIAGAGSGKTRVITFRMANMVANHGVWPNRIMAVTFTNKAAKEMASRVKELLGQNANCWVSTFHASCARLLRTYGEEAGVNPKFTIYDDQDQKAMITRVLKELALTTKQFPPRAIQSEINRAKRELVSADKYPGTDFYREKIKQIYTLYEKRMKDASALDFGDLLYLVVKAMQSNSNLAKKISGLFDYVLVDEFQDTNKVQLELVRMLTPHRNICVVGDDDQSIYSWRGADVTNILGFEKIFAGAHTVTLDRNYRSTSNILKAAHSVVEKLSGRRPKELWTSNQNGEPIDLLETDDEREEGRLIAQAVRDLCSDGFPYSQQAIFYRTNAQSRVFEEVFRSLNIPHRVVGGMRFYERAEVKDIIAYLRLIQNPADHTAFTRVVNTPTRGIGKTTIDRLTSIASGHGCSAYEAIDKIVGSNISNAAAKKLIAFRDLIESFRSEAEEGPAHLTSRIIEDTEFIKRLEVENTAEADARIENIKELAGSIEDFEADAETPTLDNFLELIVLQTDVDRADFNTDQVTLMTVHAAKGLEFDVVFVTGMEDGLFPLKRQDDAMMGESQDALDEERRLGYVAMTRARKHLFLTRAKTRRLFGNTKANPPSRYLSELPGGIIRNISPQQAQVSLIGGPATRRAASQSHPEFSKTTSFNQQQKYTTQKKPAGTTDEVWVDTSFDQSMSNTAVSPGQRVRHAKFGVGEVMSVQSGNKPKVEVKFPAFGRKTILLNYLEPE